MNRPEEDEDIADVVVALINETNKLTEEARKTITEEAGGTSTEEAGEDATQDPFLEL